MYRWWGAYITILNSYFSKPILFVLFKTYILFDFSQNIYIILPHINPICFESWKGLKIEFKNPAYSRQTPSKVAQKQKNCVKKLEKNVKKIGL